MLSTAIVLSQGNELTTGQTLDSNANWICQQLWNLGYQVRYVLVLPDCKESISTAFKESIQNAAIVISTGGLGPTDDDHTVAALKDAFNLQLGFNNFAWQHIVARYQKKNRKPSGILKKMAHLPTQAKTIENPLGTALGLVLQQGSATIYCFPGVPTEMKQMFQNAIPQGKKKGTVWEIGTIGLAESEIIKRISHLISPPNQLGFTASRRGNILKISFPGTADQDLIHEICEPISDNIFAHNNSNLAKVIGEKLSLRKETLSIAESCTSGKLAAWIGSIPGASQYFQEGVVVYSNKAKTKYCNVPGTLIKQHGAVSQQVAIALAEGIRESSGTNWSIAITGIAGPTGGSLEKPIGTVFIAWASVTGSGYKRYQFNGTREQITESSIAYALFMLYNKLTM